MFSPLEQFEVHYINLLIGGCDWGWVTNLSVTALSTTIFLLFFTFTQTGFQLGRGFSLSRYTYYTGYAWKPTVCQTIVEKWYSIVSGVVRQQLPPGEQRFTALFVWLFGWIALSNVIGLVPFNFTVTAQLSVTVFLGFGLNIGFLIWGLYYHGFKFFGLFVPSGTPVALLPLIVLIEVVSYLIRPISLSLRLFANMMAGHTLVHILLGFSAGLPNFSCFPLVSLAVFAVTLLEFGIAFLQAYVFVVLSCIYLQDALHPSH